MLFDQPNRHTGGQADHSPLLRSYESSDALFKLGIGRSATPLARLKRRYAEFQGRIMRNQSALGSSSEIEGSSGSLTYSQALARAMKESKRVMLGDKDARTGRSVHANVMRGNGQSAGLKLGPSNLANNGRKLSVFRDSEGKNGGADRGPSMPDLASRDVRRQENVKEARGWTGEKLPQKGRAPVSSALTPGKAPLKVFQDSDEEDVAPSPVKKDPFSLKGSLGSQNPESDMLKKDPFRLWNQQVQAEVKALQTVNLGEVKSVAKKAEPPKPVSASSIASKSDSKPQPTTSKDKATASSARSKQSSSLARSSSTSAAPPAKRAERLALPEQLLYPAQDPSQIASTSAFGLERSVEELIARQRGFQLGLDGDDEEEDPWSYLDVVDAPELEEEVEEVEEDVEERSQPELHEQSEEEQEQRAQPIASSSRQGSTTPTQNAPSPRVDVTRTGIKPSSPTVMTKAAQAEVFALFNGEDASDSDSASDSVETSEDEEESDDEANGKGHANGGVPPTPTPMCRRPQDENAENAGVRATPMRPNAVPLGMKRPGLGGSAQPAATPIRKPLGLSATSSSQLGGDKKKGIFVEEEEGEEENGEERGLEEPFGAKPSASREGAKRILPVAEQDDEESDPEDEGDAAAQRYNYEEGGDLLEGGARFDQLTTISERTEFETRWGMSTPGRSRLVVPPAMDEEDEEEDVPQLQPSAERSFASDSSVQRSAGHTSRFGGQAQFQMSPGYTIEKRQEASQDDQGEAKNAHGSSNPMDLIPNPCSPTDAGVIAAVLSNLDLPLESSPDFFDRSSEPSDRLATLQKLLKSQQRKSMGNSSLGGSVKDCILDIDGNPFSIREKLGEGAYGSVFLAEDVNNCAPPRNKKALGGLLGDSSFDQSNAEADDEEEEEDEDEAERKRMVAIKVEAPPNRWEFYILGQMRARLEARALESIIGARRFYAYQDESLLLLEWGEKGTLLEIVNQAASAGVAPVGATTGVEEILAMFFTVELLRLVEGLHSAQLLHGDLKIDNCLLRLDEAAYGQTWSNAYKRDGSNGWASKGLFVVDFGRAVDLSAFAPGQHFIADWETDGRDCAEMRRGQPWTYEVDYHGVASVAHCLLFGKYIETSFEGDDLAGRETITSTFKRYWQGHLWSKLFDALLNPSTVRSDGALPITDGLASIRMEMEGWLEENCNKGGKNLKGLLKKLEIWTMSRRG